MEKGRGHTFPGYTGVPQQADGPVSGQGYIGVRRVQIGFQGAAEQGVRARKEGLGNRDRPDRSQMYRPDLTSI